jgi:hypothetical protein
MTQRYVSSELTHFVGRTDPDDEVRYARLVKILRGRVLTSDPESPQSINRIEGVVGYQVAVGELFSEPESYSLDCVCFCDIPLPDLPLHMAKYGRFGLAFAKTFLIPKGANPVFYLATNSPARHVSRRVYFDRMVANIQWLIDRLRRDYPNPTNSTAAPEVRDRLEQMFNFVNLYLLCFAKLFDDHLDVEHPDNFYMEREWRVPGVVAFTMDDVRRILLPESFARRFREGFPKYAGQVSFAE